MEAKDTVIKGAIKQDLKITWTNTITGHLLGFQPTLELSAQNKFDDWIREIRLEQAEHSFKAGIKEVVEFVGEIVYLWHDEENKAHICLDKELWQAKLKKWGIGK